MRQGSVWSPFEHGSDTPVSIKSDRNTAVVCAYDTATALLLHDNYPSLTGTPRQPVPSCGPTRKLHASAREVTDRLLDSPVDRAPEVTGWRCVRPRNRPVDADVAADAGLCTVLVWLAERVRLDGSSRVCRQRCVHGSANDVALAFPVAPLAWAGQLLNALGASQDKDQPT